jgi:hypothetical protein
LRTLSPFRKRRIYSQERRSICIHLGIGRPGAAELSDFNKVAILVTDVGGGPRQERGGILLSALAKRNTPRLLAVAILANGRLDKVHLLDLPLLLALAAILLGSVAGSATAADAALLGGAAVRIRCAGLLQLLGKEPEALTDAFLHLLLRCLFWVSDHGITSRIRFGHRGPLIPWSLRLREHANDLSKTLYEMSSRTVVSGPKF